MTAHRTALTALPWTLIHRAPCPALRPHVRRLTAFHEWSGQAVLRKELPSATIPMILVFGPGFTLHDSGEPHAPWRPLVRSFVAGLHERPALVGSLGHSLCLQVDFTPLGARRFLGLPLGEILGEVFDLNALLGAEIDRLEARLAEAPDWDARFAVVEAALLARIERAPAPHALLAAAWERLVRPERRGGLAAALGCSRQHLVTLCRREIGLPPRTLARLVRFEHAITALERREVSSLADLAAACGYADQAHLSRDVRRFTGESPRALSSRLRPDGSLILAETG
jgi:AraC-like DNA-binding protein